MCGVLNVEQVRATAERALVRGGADVRLERAKQLKSSSRTLVVRAQVRGPGSGLGSVVVKASVDHETGEGVVREPAALRLLSESRATDSPRLLAVADDPPLVVLEDLGDVGSLADALLGRSSDAAHAQLLAWAGSLGDLHARTSGWAPRFADALAGEATRLQRPTPSVDHTPARATHSAGLLSQALDALGMEAAPDAIAELLALPSQLGGGPLAHALTPSDACPDNNAIATGSVTFFDFEGAQVRHVAWDAAYLTVPWPSCWCAWAMDAASIDAALERWRTRAARTIPYVATADFDADLATATLGWSVMSSAWFLDRLVHPTRGSRRLSRHAPPIAAVIGHRLRHAAAVTDNRFPLLPRLAGDLLDRLALSNRVLPLAPAFRRR